MRVLIVDDDEIASAALRNTLERGGYEVEEARDGHEALAMIRQGRLHLVISDWMMPGLDGIELCRRIRSEGFDGYVYVILVTARTARDSVVEALSAGADDFLLKPFDPEELRVRVRAAERVLSLETRDVAIFALARLAESRDPETGAHLDRVRNYSRVLSQHLLERPQGHERIDAEFVQLIYRTSPLHDIGKVGIPDCVLLKGGRLNDREWDIMKSHTTIGADTLKAAMNQFPTMRFLRMGFEIAAFHHERFDGSGYPNGLSGEQIPLSARIVALSDVYDALTSKRVYKDAYTHDIARSIIVGDSGKHFDPRVVEAFEATEAQFVAIGRRYQKAAPTPSPAPAALALAHA